MSTLNYAEYSAIYPNGMTEAAFNGYLPSAVAYIDVITHNRASTAVGYKAERVARAVYAVTNEMAAQDAARGENGARVTSVSNDGYSESYGASSAATDSAAIRAAAFMWLSGTGLVSAL